MYTLDEIKQKYHEGSLNAMKVGHLVKHFTEELNQKVPLDISLSAKMYVYLHNIEFDQVQCQYSTKAKRFASFSKGFQKYCGNQGSCVCNKNDAAAKLTLLTRDDHKARTAKRKETNRKRYGAEFASQTKETKEKTKATCIKQYGTPSPTQNPEVLAKSSATCQANNGVFWPQQSHEVYQKTTNTFKSRYGVSRPAQHPDIVKKMQATMMERYNVPSSMHIETIAAAVAKKSKRAAYSKLSTFRADLKMKFSREEYVNSSAGSLFLWECCKCSTSFYETIANTLGSMCPICNAKTNMTWGEQVIASWLDKHSVEYERNYTKLISPQHVDFFVPKLGLAIEFNGTYWHSERANRGKKYHVDKFKKCKEQSVKLIQIFEHELLANERKIKNRILHAIGHTPNKIAARKLSCCEISSVEAKNFLQDHHLQGGMLSKINYGLISNTGELYAVMSFSVPRFSKKTAEWELTRFASKSGWSVIGGANKLFSHFLKNRNPNSVISYANLQWGEGDVYRQLSFSFLRYSNPSYWYFKNVTDIRNRVQFQKHKLPQELHYLGSEWDIMQHLGWNRFWDCGNAVWLWNK